MNQAEGSLTSRLAAYLATPSGFFGLLAAYLGLHFVMRLLLSSTIGVDDVAEAIYAQSLQWSYYPRQPPLYTWLVWGSFQIFGVSLAAVTAVKYALVALSYAFFYLSARRMFTDRALVLAAALSPSLIFAVGWGFHVGFTNTALLTAACAGTFYAFLRLCDRGAIADYVWLGLAVSAGLLSKWGFPAFAGSLVIAGLFQESSRRRLLNPRIFVTLAIAAALLAPFAIWGFSAARVNDVFQADMRHGGHVPYVPGVVAGLKTLVVSIAAFLAPLWIFGLIVFPKSLTARHKAAAIGLDHRRLLERFFMVTGVVLLAGVFVFGITFFKSRWLHPILLLFPLYFFCLVRDSGYSARQMRIWAAILIAAAAAAVGMRLGQDLAGPPFCGKCRLLKPYPELTRDIQARGFSGGTVVAGDEHIAGNVRMVAPEARVATSKYPFYIPPLRDGAAGQCLVIWDAREGDTVPGPLADFLGKDFGAVAAGPTQSVEASYHYDPSRTLRLNFRITPGTGDCR